MVFSHEMIIPSNYKELLEKYLGSDKNFIGVSDRGLQEGEDQLPLLTLEYQPSNPDEEARDLQFGWRITEYIPRQLTIQLEFEEAKYVSAYDVSDFGISNTSDSTIL